ncbi:Rrp7 protein [Pichia kluyveri]|uniref:Rrp7 protein n=1 Tax=Pichia kluyveri TaxID=36015 RepID=A0AAV5REB6_PICKL|nr:Rrp7 protein [Pichia kluyveri]
MTTRGFVKLEIALPEVANLPSSTHCCYVKPHTSKLPNQQQDNTCSLFVVNPLPQPMWTLASVRTIFRQISSASHISNVLLHDCIDESRVSSIGSGVNYDLHINLSILSNPDLGSPLSEEEMLPFGTSVVTFVDRDGLELFLTNLTNINNNKSKKKDKIITWKGDENVSLGFERYSKVQNLVNRDEMEKIVAKSLLEFQNREKEAEDDVNNLKNIVDEDGFTLVVGPQRKTKSEILGSLRKKKLEKDVITTNDKKEKEDFYRFQIRERKKQEMGSLLAKFREDQERVKLMRQRRKFRPY